MVLLRGAQGALPLSVCAAPPLSLVTASGFRSVGQVSESSYRVAPIFLIRMAGVPFDVLEKLGTIETARLARELVVRQDEFVRAKTEVERILGAPRHGLSKELFRAWRKAIRSGTMPPAEDPPSEAFAQCWRCASSLAEAESLLEKSLQAELELAQIGRAHV